ncbi:MAG: thiamine phosphate synthase [Odoribacteraceae bacterium]|jgi:thiamine-phosphate pyrophosphorylase|nr:thiamine phosphate synthase [Odoribacteraceae bacterium]
MIIVITPPLPTPGEAVTCNALFRRGLLTLHVRRPGATREEYEEFIRGILPPYRDRLVVHDHFDLVARYGLKGVHASFSRPDDLHRAAPFAHASVSCHSPAEVMATDDLPFAPAYIFLSPVFDSISKPGYAAASFPHASLRAALKGRRVVALGGVTGANLPACRREGFAGGALLGYIWERPAAAVERFTRLPPPPVLSIAGFDPTSGAGVSADVKTMEAHGARGLGACSAITFQNQRAYQGTAWMPTAEVVRQCEALFQEFTPTVVKIGLVESFDALAAIVAFLRERLPDTRIIWDPILAASAGFTFHRRVEREKLEAILSKIDLVTPNDGEAEKLFAGRAPAEICRQFGMAVLWKGGHAGGEAVTDRLFLPDGSRQAYTVPRSTGDKHGTGCFLSAAIAALLARGYSLEEACREGQESVARFVLSTPTLLGTHGIPRPKPSPRDVALQFITDPSPDATLAEQAEAACRGGVRWVQLRAKNLTDAELLLAGRDAREVCRRHGALFIVNDRVEVAAALDADGVHLGNEDMDPVAARRLLGLHKIIGATCNRFEEIALRARQGVDYIGLGPFAHTTTKARLAPLLGLDGYRRVVDECRAAGITVPVYAIGGIRMGDIGALARTGVAGIAVSSLVNRATDPTAAARAILDELSLYKQRD